ncbi:LAMI_0E08328g1_1 [Lachancea mirantina]|uniref:LAMI_0E08328g1_1 n=1 Tax=Lachancea mirantina TaxID=1230905 RepID=A0A1G4JN26_9SACH|nr:LAMI_0E08328g1_1 [Lachancea mirantina]
MSNESAKIYAKLTQNAGQKASLTSSIVPQLAWALHRLYPALIIFDGFLSNVLWCCDDKCLPFINLVLWTLAIGLIDPRGSSFVAKSVYVWLGLMSAFFLTFSWFYYVSSVVRDLEQAEPPTADDIVIVMENVVFKLKRLADDFRLLLDRRALRRLTVYVLLLTPFYVFATHFFWGPRDILTGILVIGGLFHSSWCQSTLRLCWRSLWVRRLWYFLSPQSNGVSQAKPYIVLSENSEIPFPRALEGIVGHELGIKLQKIISDPIVWDGDHAGKVNVKIVEFQIDENQRKWPSDGWTSGLLPYERPKFSFTANTPWLAASSPWEFQENLDRCWFWMDDCWKPSSWTYFDSGWRFKGQNDSIDCYTRNRTWKRKAYRLL